jgi:hypothetical protein
MHARAQATRGDQNKKCGATHPGRGFRNWSRHGRFRVRRGNPRRQTLRTYAEACAGDCEITVGAGKTAEVVKAFQLPIGIRQENRLGNLRRSFRFGGFGTAHFRLRCCQRARNGGHSLGAFFARRVEGHRPRFVDARFIRRVRRTFRFDIAESRVRDQDRAAHAKKSKAEDCRQRKPRNGEPSSAMMFGSGRHIVLLKSTICSAEKLSFPAKLGNLIVLALVIESAGGARARAGARARLRGEGAIDPARSRRGAARHNAARNKALTPP